MRDTLFILLLLMGGAFTYVLTRDRVELTPETGVRNGSVQPVTQTGGKHGKIGSHSIDQETSGEAEGSPDSHHETQELHSIYGEEKHDPTSGVNRPKRGGKRVMGVPLDSYVQVKRNTLHYSSPRSKEVGGLRIFVGCMELKNGSVDPLSEKECKSLALKSSLDDDSKSR